MDNKPVLSLNNFHDFYAVQPVYKNMSEDIASLEIVKDFNAHICFVDQSELVLSLLSKSKVGLF